MTTHEQMKDSPRAEIVSKGVRIISLNIKNAVKEMSTVKMKKSGGETVYDGGTLPEVAITGHKTTIWDAIVKIINDIFASRELQRYYPYLIES